MPPKSAKTGLIDLIYGLLESYAYGLFVDYYLSNTDYRCLFEKELQACCAEFHPQHSEIKTDILTAGFALAAPNSYFEDDIKHRTMSDKKQLTEWKKLKDCWKQSRKQERHQHGKCS